MRKLHFLILFPILLHSCPLVYWANPVSDIRNAVVDERLIGTWVGCLKISSGGETSTFPLYLHIGKMEGKRMMVISQSVQSGSTQEGIDIMHISKLDGRRFMNIMVSNSNGEFSNRYLIMEYEIKEKDTLLLRDASPAFLGSKGERDFWIGPDILVNAKSSKIREIIRNSPKDQLFPRKLKVDGTEQEYCSFKRLIF